MDAESALYASIQRAPLCWKGQRRPETDTPTAPCPGSAPPESLSPPRPRQGDAQLAAAKGPEHNGLLHVPPHSAPLTVTQAAHGGEERTPAEIRFAQKQNEREEQQLERLAKQSYRDQVEQFNTRLAKQPAHFDVPKISHTK